MTSVGANHRPLRDVVCDEVRARIISGEFPPGTHLVEEKLAKELEVSRNPVREGLRVLESEGFVRMVPRRGVVVASPSDEDVHEIFEVRKALEALAARLAARKRTERDIADLADILERSHRALEAGRTSELTELNTEFHERVLSIAGNAYLREVMLRMRSRMQWIFAQTASSIRGRHSLDEHQQLADAVIGGDEERAAQLGTGHVAAAEDSYWEARARTTSA